VGDFNRDGKADIAVAVNFNVAVLLGNGDGTFKPATYYPVGTGPEFIYAVDLRQNGTLDLVVSDFTSQDISVLLGNGDGTFGAAAPLSLVGSPYFAGTADFNHDGYPDIFAAVDNSFQCGCIAVLLGNGDGTFGSPIYTPTWPYPPYVAAAGRFDQSGNMDLVAGESTGGSSQIQILLGNGDGTFQFGDVYQTGSSAQSIVTANFRNNGKMDLAVVLPLSGNITMFLGNGDGTFTQGTVIPASFPAAAQTGDFNGDGKADLVFLTGPHSTMLTTYLGNGDGTFRFGRNYVLGHESTAPAIGDFNGDLRQDIVVPNYLGGSVVTLLNTGVVSFSPTNPLNFKKQPVGTTSAPQSVTLTNTGKTALTISSMKATGQFGMTSTCGASVTAGANCSISVTFSPKTKGAKSGTITINDSASSKPQVIELSGTGT
jgi:hypothetical protein